MNNAPAAQYLALMKKVLSFTLWDEPGVPIDMFNYMLPFPTRALVRVVVQVLGVFGFQVVKLVRSSQSRIEEGKTWPMYAHTMIGLRRLDNLQDCVQKVLDNNIEGDLIETGVWRGGASIFMRAILAANQITDRRVFVADSFAGLPEPDADKYPQDTGDKLHAVKYLAITLEDVKANFAKYDLLDDQVVFLKGWFKDTLPTAPIDKLAVMRLDGDMYGSTMDALVNLYPKLSKGGFCIIDDYALPTCKQAIDDFRTTNDIKSPLIKVDWTGAFWQKE